MYILNWFQALKELMQLDIPVYLHEISLLQSSLVNKLQEKCPVFNPHDRSDPNNKHEVLVPHDELYIR